MAELDVEASAIVDAIDDALVVVSDAGEVVECNEAFESVLADCDSDAGPIETVVDSFPALERHLRHCDGGVIPVDTDGQALFFRLSVSPLETDGDTDLSLVVLHDVTDQQRQRRKLQRENEQLDQFASVISHDLRNPLDVAIGRTAVLDELAADPQVERHLSVVRDSHARMSRIIQNVLTLARQGRCLDDKRAVDLSNVAAGAWSHVETDGATIDVATDTSVLADAERLGRVFENLFRNSVEHGGRASPDPITVVIGALEDRDGFYVADDGGGIDSELRGRVLGAGVSGGDGTGLGLAIVSNIAAAHGWDITVTESESGGARFEFTGVEVAASG